MKKFIIFLILTITILPMEKYLYEQDRKDYPKEFYISKDTKENYIYYEFSDGVFTEIFHLDKNSGETLFWHYIDTKKDIDVKSEKINDKVEISGLFEGKKIEKTEKLEGYSWRQIFPMGLEEEINTNKKYTFKALAPDGPRALDISKMYIKKEGAEEVEVYEKKYESIKVKVSLPGLLSIFWSGEYWYNKESSIIIKGIEPQRKLVFIKKIDI